MLRRSYTTGDTKLVPLHVGFADAKGSPIANVHAQAYYQDHVVVEPTMRHPACLMGVARIDSEVDSRKRQKEQEERVLLRWPIEGYFQLGTSLYIHSFDHST